MNYRQILNKKQGEKQRVKNNLKDYKKKYKQNKVDLDLHEKALEVVNQVGEKTQNQLKYHISDITSMALDSVFDDAYNLVLEFVRRRNKTEADIYFERNGNKINPIDASGVGAVDVASFALRIACWSMTSPKSRNTIILDEPFKFLSKDKQEMASEMIKQLSEKLGLQFIIVTHEEILTQYADKVFTVKRNKKVSQVTSN